MKRIRLVIVALALVVAGGLLHGQSRPAPSEPRSGESRGPIKIGFIVPLSGPFAQNGRDILNGFLLLLDEIGYRAGGRETQWCPRTT
jgi:ABC-type branched-subunit amino acid transport system substrate-binding protein